MDPVDGKPTITAIHLLVRAQVPDIAAAQFAEIASSAKVNCVVSRALSPGITVTMDASLSS
jgi:osmotically inducible protein OsmC